ncbi:TIGR01459 family HAD-type hydrolase [Pelagibacteraceae bacterium]|nr:TIGR01459 family HAD-type hydrolase [Pelagibacteraceae bacterium]
MKKLNHLSEIYENYDTYIIDLWGVIHNGVILHRKAIEAVENLIQRKKKVIFLTNAPRPCEEVKKFLRNLKINEELLENVVSSGEAAMQSLKEKKYGEFFFHLGPEKDDSIFFNIKEKRTSIEKCNFILCTGVLDTHEEDIDYYKNLLKNYISKKLICTNPDLIVHRGNIVEYCAGTIAQVFETLGGQVIYFGKPYKEIYNMCFSANEKVIAIGDNLNTDIRGANNMNIDSIFISNGVHRSEFKQESELSYLSEKYRIKLTYHQPELIW